MDRVCIAIDLKSFFASCEAVSRGFDPLDVNLVVADKSRTSKTICLAVSPALRKYGISSRSRLFQVESAVSMINDKRRRVAGGKLAGKSYLDSALSSDPKLELAFIIAPPHMKAYMDVSRMIYENVYMKYLAPCDIFAYSIDEVFIDATSYLRHYGKCPDEFARMLVKEILKITGITATAGIGPNLFLAKVAMDVFAKRIEPDEDGVRVACLDVAKYRRELWEHQPITDFWMIGSRTAQRLAYYGIRCMGDLSMFSLEHEGVLYSEFGVNAEFLIDHAWGWEPCSIRDIKSYESERKSLSTSQVLPEGYANFDAGIILEEMVEDLVLEMNSKGFMCNAISLRLDYDVASLKGYDGDTVKDYYGRMAPKPFNMSHKLRKYDYSLRRIKGEFLDLFERADRKLMIRRLTICLDGLETFDEVRKIESYTLFDDKDDDAIRKEDSEIRLNREINRMKARYGKNILLKASSYLGKSRARERNGQIGGHKS